MATTEVKALNAVLKNSDKNALFAHSVEDLFVSHGDTWAYIKDYYARYSTLPPFEVVKEKWPDLEDVETKGKTMYYMEALKTEYIENRVENLLTVAGKKMSKEHIPAVEVKARLQVELAKLDRFEASGRALEIMNTEEAERYYEEVRARSEAMGGTPGVPTGLDFIDASMVLGMQPGDIVSIIGYPARGKSALGTLFAAKAIAKGYKPLIVSREMSAEAVRDRIYTVMGSGLFSNTDLMMGQVNKDDFREWAQRNDGTGWVLDANGAGAFTPNTIRASIDQYRPDFLILDYMQLCNDNRMSSEMTPRMMNLSLELKALSNETQIPFVVISSATPPDGGKVDGPPNVERSAWSRQLSYDSSVCIAVHRHDDTDIYEVACAKNRYGPLFHGFLEWDMDRGTYEEKFDLN